MRVDCMIKRLRALAPAIAVFFSGMAPLAAQVPDSEPHVTLSGVITGADHQTYKRIPFELPEGTERLVAAFDYDHREEKTVIDLGVEDMHGFRGASGGNKPSFTISETDATPSYLAGRLEPGPWALSLAVPNIRKGVTARWTAKLWFLSGAEAQVLPAPTAGRGPGWYRGDLHLHSAHSDGSCDSQASRRVPCPLFKTLEEAAARKLDFVAITEHNTASHADALREAQPYFDELLLIPGREVTTFWGHFNIFGVTAPIDFRIAPGVDNSFNRIADRTHALGGVVSINHPALPSGEICMGCGWTMPDVVYDKVDAVEIVNGSSIAAAGGDALGPVSGVPFWIDRNLEAGPIAAIGGSDNHDPAREGLGAVGRPVTVVNAEDLTQRAILKAIAAGRAFIAMIDDPSLRLDFTAEAQGESAKMGGVLEAAAEAPIAVQVDAAAPAGARIELLQGNQVVRTLSSTTGGGASLALPEGVHVIRPQIRDADGRVIAIGNAILLRLTGEGGQPGQ